MFLAAVSPNPRRSIALDLFAPVLSVLALKLELRSSTSMIDEYPPSAISLSVITVKFEAGECEGSVKSSINTTMSASCAFAKEQMNPNARVAASLALDFI